MYAVVCLLLSFLTGLFFNDVAALPQLHKEDTQLDGDTPPYPVFPINFVGELNITDPRHPELTTQTFWMAVVGSETGQRKIKQVIRFGNSSSNFSYLVLDHAPNARPGSKSANHTVIIAENGNLPPRFDFSPWKCEYATFIQPWMILPRGLAKSLGYGGFGCDEGGACVPTGLEYAGVATMDTGKKAHEWKRVIGSGSSANYYFYTDVETNLPVYAHAWKDYHPPMFDTSFNNELYFNIVAEKAPNDTFIIPEGSGWAEKCRDRDMGPPGASVHPDRIFAANSTTDDFFTFVIGDEPLAGGTNVSFFIVDSFRHSANCTSKFPCVSIIPDSLVFEPANWGPQHVRLRFLRPGVSSFGYRVCGGGYNYTTISDASQIVYTCEHGHTGLDGCNM